MPFKSLAQEHYMHAHPEILGKTALKEWDSATKGKHLPEHSHMQESGYGGLAHGKAEPSKPHQHPVRAKHGIKRTVIEHADDGSHTIKHEHDAGHQTHHNAADVDHLKQNLDMMLNPQSEEPAEGESAAPAME
jgi:hypothetical protein